MSINVKQIESVGNDSRWIKPLKWNFLRLMVEPRSRRLVFQLTSIEHGRSLTFLMRWFCWTRGRGTSCEGACRYTVYDINMHYTLRLASVTNKRLIMNENNKWARPLQSRNTLSSSSCPSGSTTPPLHLHEFISNKRRE